MIDDFLHVSITCRDLERSVRFYETLGLKVIRRFGEVNEDGIARDFSCRQAGIDIYHSSQDAFTGAEIAFGGDLARSMRAAKTFSLLRRRRKAFPNGRPIRARFVCRHIVCLPRVPTWCPTGIGPPPRTELRQVEGGTVMGISMTLFEEVHFDESGVISSDWRNYPIATMADTPEIEVVLIHHPEVGKYGQGSETVNALAASAVAGALLHATAKRHAAFR